MKRILIGIVVCFLLISTSLGIAYGQDFKRNYIVLKGGAYTPTSSDLDGFDTGFSGEVAFGTYLSRNLALEFGGGFSKTEGNFYGHDYYLGSYYETDTLEMKPVTVSLKLIAPFEGGEFYVLGGMGANFVYGKIEINSQYYGNLSISDDQVAFIGQLGAGMSFNITPNLFLGFEGKYIWSTVEFEYYGYTLDATLDGFLYTANVGFRF